jgi:hypothetical protein
LKIQQKILQVHWLITPMAAHILNWLLIPFFSLNDSTLRFRFTDNSTKDIVTHGTGSVTVESDPVAIAKTITITPGIGMLESASTQALNVNPSFTTNIDTFAISTRAWRQKLADSLGAIIGTKVSSETDPVATAKTITENDGYGLIESSTATQSLVNNPSWTRRLDTFAISTRAWRQKLADSLGTIISTKIFVDTAFTVPAVYTDTVKYTKNGNTYTAALIDHTDDRLFGLTVTSGGGLTLNVTSGAFRLLDGNRYTSAGGSTTLATADPSLPRKDVIYVDNTGAIGHITGTAATNPTTPQVDPVTQLLLTEVNVDAGATSINVTPTIIYDEPSTDAFTGTNTGVTVNYTNTSNVQHLTQSADVGSWTNGQTITFTKNSGTLVASDFSNISGFIKLKSALASTANIRVSFLNGTTVVSNVITLAAAQGFSKTVLTYQNIAIPISAFTFSSTTFNKIRITLAGTGGGFYLDFVQLQNGISQSTQETDPIATAKTISVNAGTNVTVTGNITQSLNSNPSWTINSDDLDAYHTVTQLNDSAYTLNRPNGTKDTIQFKSVSSSGTSITLAAIGSSPNNNGMTLAAGTLNLEPYDATHGGVTTTLAQTAAGNKTFTGNTFLTGTLQTNATSLSGNLYIPSASSTANVNDSRYNVGSTSVGTDFRSEIGGGVTNATIVANGTYASVIIPQVSITEASSGTHNVLATLALQGLSVTAGAAAVTRTATIYIGGAGNASGATNYGLYNNVSTNAFTPGFTSDANTITSSVTTSTGAGNFGAGGTNVNFYAKQTASHTSNNVMNINSSVTLSGASGTPTTVGINSDLSSSGNPVASSVIGFRSSINNNGTGTMTNWIGLDVNFGLGTTASANAPTITNGYGLKVETPGRLDSAKFTNYYGVYVDTVHINWVTATPYGFYQKANFDNTIQNLFEGNTMIGAGTKSASAVLQLNSTTQGFLGPRMTNTQRDAISSPAEGLMIYSTTDHAYEFFNGTAWKQVQTL